ADVVAERELRAGHLARSRLAAELEHVLVDHAHARRAGRVAEALETPVGVDGQLAAELEGAARDVLPGRSLLAEAQVLVREQLGEREAVVELRDLDLAARVVDARLAVGVGRGPGS